ncbi:ABC transporter substrate-binding protein [Corynebacterium mendelii]|uniref:Extracellular solute-binding protein n=1 Tax=Corynebacterium mendelii TaxID=2765362 RepID=A0A939E0H9_9CORY|nr:extracellular solute-binding protein [Corynebacterium mendelii]MBN9643232.1 extracellular solute-binding protein [Corynebacterium mendelii]
MKSSRRLTMSLTAVVSTLGLVAAGCSSTDDTADNSGKTLKEGEVAQITWLHRIPDKEGAPTVNELVEQFNQAHPDIQVTPERMQGSATESYAKINSIVAAGKDVPCLTMIGNERVPDMIGSMMDVSQYTDKVKDNYWEGLYNKAKVGDKVYGLPFGASPILFYYRADLFEQYGISVPTTWEEYKAAAKTVREKSEGKSYMGAFLTDEPMWTNALVTSEGADWFGYDPSTQEWSVSITGDESKKVADNLDTMVADDLVVPMQRWGQDFGKALADGTLLSTIGGAWEAPLIADTAPSTSGNWKIAQIPHFEASTTTVGQNGGTIGAVLKGCEYPEQAIEFANWWATNIEGLTGLGLLPAAKADNIETPANLKEFYSGQDYYSEFITANNNAPTIHWAPKIAATMKVLKDKQGTIGSGGTVAEELEAGQQQAVASLTDAGLKVTE